MLGDIGANLLAGNSQGAASAALGGAKDLGVSMVKHQLNHGGRGIYYGGGGTGFAGRGEYNTLFNEGPNPIGIQSINAEHGNIIITDSEKVKDIYGLADPSNNAFETFTIAIQPGDFNSFPKLSQTAGNWKEYEMIQCVYTFKSTVPETYTTDELQTGRIYMFSESDLKQPIWSSADQMEDLETVTVGSINSIGQKEHFHGVECDPGKIPGDGHRFVRTRVEIDDDQNDKYDVGRFQFGVFGTQESYANKIIGELHVTYKIILKNHRMYSFYGFSIPESVFTKRYGDYGVAGLQDNNVSSYTAPQLMTTDGLKSSSYPELKNLTIFKDYTLTAPRMSYSNIDVLVSNKKVDSRVGFKALGSDKCVAVIAPQGLTRWATDKYSQGRAMILLTPITFTFPSSLKGDFEIDVCIEGNNLAPMVMNSYIGSAHNLYDLELSKFNTLIPQPRKSGNVKFNYDMISNNMQSSSTLAPDFGSWNGVTDNYDDSDDSIRIAHVTSQEAWEGNEVSTEQRQYDCQLSSSSTRVKCHIHLGVAVNSLGDNVVELWVPVCAKSVPINDVRYAESGEFALSPGVTTGDSLPQNSADHPDVIATFNNLFRNNEDNFKQSLSLFTGAAGRGFNITNTQVSVKQYNAQQQTQYQGKPYSTSRDVAITDYDVNSSNVMSEVWDWESDVVS